MARILVTGAAGFIGRALCPALAARGHRVVAGLRCVAPTGLLSADIEPRVLGTIAPDRDWRDELSDLDVVIHLAQHAHRAARRGAFAGEPEAADALARAAACSGVRRFVYLSSIRAMGEASLPDQPFRAADPPQPGDVYGWTKLATERALAQLADETGLEAVICRPPLVYGPGAGGNFRRLVRLAGSGLPLPFAAVKARRSLLAIDNLVDLVAMMTVHPAAAGRILLAADGPGVSIATLIGLLAEAQGRTARLFALPDAVLALLRALPGLGPPLSQLTLSLEVDDTATRAALGWSPPVAAETALRAAARLSAP